MVGRQSVHSSKCSGVELSIMGERFVFDPSSRASWAEDGQCLVPDTNTSAHPQGLTVTLNLTNQCNLRCTYCYEESESEPRALEIGEIRRALREARHAAGLPLTVVHFFGGEPLLEFGLLQEVVAMCRCDFPDTSFAVSTNGTLLDRRSAMALMEHGVRVIVSWDGEGRHRRRMDGTDCSAEVFENLRDAAPILGSSLWVRMTVTPDVLDLVSPMVRLAEFGCRSLLLKDVSPGESGLGWQGQAQRQALYDKLARFFLGNQGTPNALQLYGRGTGFTTILKDLDGAEPRTRGCDCGITRLTVTADGVYVPCSRYDPGEHTLGCVGDGLICDFSCRYSLTSSPPACSLCFAQPVCGGPCHAAAEQTPPNCGFCDITRHRVALGIWLRHHMRQSKKERKQ
jgi:uncharacterized protein